MFGETGAVSESARKIGIYQRFHFQFIFDIYDIACENDICRPSSNGESKTVIKIQGDDILPCNMAAAAKWQEMYTRPDAVTRTHSERFLADWLSV